MLVIGDDYEGQLAPYDENIEVAPYRRYADTKDLEWYERVYRDKNDGRDPKDHKELARFLSREWGERFNYEEEGGIYQMSTYNPRSKWDWYTVGGRWRGYFKLHKWSSRNEAWNAIHAEAVERGLDHDEAVTEADRYVAWGEFADLPKVGEAGVFDNEPEFDADQVLKGDVDIEGMRQAAEDKAAEWWDRVDYVLKHLPEAEPWESFYGRVLEAQDVARDGGVKTATYTIEQAREEYGAQQRVAELRKHNDLSLWGVDGVVLYQRGRDAYLQRARIHALAPFAYLKDGEWEEPGKMGWWGMSSDSEQERLRWNAEFNEMFDRLPADTRLTLVDCHI